MAPWVALTILYMTLGTTGIAVHINQWAAFYLDVFTMRLVLYLCLRRFNISPHEAPGSFGMSGIFMSILCTPFYSTAFVSTFLRRTLRFDVTPKSAADESDRAWQSFRKHWFWSAVSAAVIGDAIMLHHTYGANMVWAILGFVTSMLPFTIWSPARRGPTARDNALVEHRQGQHRGHGADSTCESVVDDQDQVASPCPAPVGQGDCVTRRRPRRRR